MDDILIAGRDTAHHDSILEAVLHRAKSYSFKLNFEKVRVRKQQVQYVGHIISAAGLKPDPEKVRAMRDMLAIETKEDVRRFLGSIQYLAKFLPMLREDLLFDWDKSQANAFQKLKDMCRLSQTPFLWESRLAENGLFSPAARHFLSTRF